MKGLVSLAEHEELFSLSRQALGAITPLIRYLDTAKPPPLDDAPDN